MSGPAQGRRQFRLQHSSDIPISSSYFLRLNSSTTNLTVSGTDGDNSISDTNAQSSSSPLTFHNFNSNVDLLCKLAVYYPEDYIYPRLIAEALFEKKQYSEAGFYFDHAIQPNPKIASVTLMRSIKLDTNATDVRKI